MFGFSPDINKTLNLDVAICAYQPHEIILSVHDHTPGVHPQTKVTETVEQIDTLVLLDLAAF